MFDPDTRPRDLNITLPHASPAARKMCAGGTGRAYACGGRPG